MNDTEYMRLALELAKKRMRMDIPKSDGGCCHCKRWSDHRADGMNGMASPMRSEMR